MDWDKLRIFHTVASAGSFTAAGEDLNLNQSSVSRQIGALEEELGVILFHRHSRGLLLTEQGEILKKTSHEVFEKLHRVAGQLQDTRQLAEGPLVVTVSEFINSTWLAPKLKEFNDLYPEIQLTVLIEDRPLNLAMREADAAIRLHIPNDRELIMRHLTSINYHICASKNYLEQHGTPTNLEELRAHRLISFPKNAYSPVTNPGWILDITGIDTEKDHNVLMINSTYAIFQTVLNDGGIAVLPDYLICRSNEIVSILPDTQRDPSEMYFVYAQERKNSARISIFRDFLLDTIHNTPF